MSDLDVLALNDFDRVFMRSVGIDIEDAAWEIEEDDKPKQSVCPSHRPPKFVILNQAIDGATGFSYPEAAE